MLKSDALEDKLLLFAIKMATLPFWAQIKNLRTRHGKAYKFVSSGLNNIILSDLERYDVGLPEYVKIMRNIYDLQSKLFWAQLPHFPCSISLSILVVSTSFQLIWKGTM